MRLLVNYLPPENDPLWTCVPETADPPSSTLEVDEDRLAEYGDLKEATSVTIDFLDNEAYADLPIPPNKIAFMELGTAQEGLELLEALGYKPPTVEEVCAEYGTRLGQFDLNGVEIE